jgi:hypothetical protein
VAPGVGYNQGYNQATAGSAPKDDGEMDEAAADADADAMDAPGTRSPGGGHGGTLASRRERNREHAKKSRVRKKFMLESLQQEVRMLQKENIKLRMEIQKGCPHNHREILAAIGTPSVLFADPGEVTPSDDGSATSSMPSNADQDMSITSKMSSHDVSLVRALSSGQQNFVLSDPTLPDNPIVFASPGFYDLTGYVPGANHTTNSSRGPTLTPLARRYKSSEVLGRNCRFLQGTDTSPESVEIIRNAIANGTDASVCMLNYKADGTPFWNQFFIAALRNEDNAIVNYMGVQCEVKEQVVEGVNEVEEKVNEKMPLKKD